MRRMAVVLWVALGVSAGCTDDNASLFISGNVAPDDDCFYSPSNALWLGGSMDVSLTNIYYAAPLYNNQLITRQSEGPLAADPNGIHIEGAVVELRDTSGAAIGDAFTVSSSTYVPPGTGDSAGQSVGSLELVPPAFGVMLQATVAADAYTEIVASVTPFGATTGGTEIEAREWLWPIYVCSGCLVRCATADELMTAMGGACFPGNNEETPVACAP